MLLFFFGDVQRNGANFIAIMKQSSGLALMVNYVSLQIAIARTLWEMSTC